MRCGISWGGTATERDDDQQGATVSVSEERWRTLQGAGIVIAVVVISALMFVVLELLFLPESLGFLRW